jgi:lysozyme family protein
MTFDQLFAQLINIEQGYSNNAADSGGETNHGITVAVARAYGYTGAMRDLPKETARAIFLQRYWRQPRFDQIEPISAAIAYELFDTGVNMGQAVAAKFLQRALNLLNRRALLFADIAADGAIGAMTIAALRAFLGGRGADGETVILRMLNAQQSVRYMEIAEQRPKDEDFVFGWNLNRVEM